MFGDDAVNRRGVRLKMIDILARATPSTLCFFRYSKSALRENQGAATHASAR